MHKEGLYLVFGILFIGLASANGLTVDPSSIVVNKTLGNNEVISLNLTNNEPFPFYNISFDSNSVISMDQIGTLGSGQSVEITATIFSNSNVHDDFRIEGFYNSNLGQSNETYEVDVEFLTGLSHCDMTLIVGDKILWHNNVLDPITMKNADTGETITTIPEGQDYLKTFSSPGVLRYYFLRSGFQFTNTCEITTLSSSGLINNPEYDAILNLDLNLILQETTISASTSQTSYTMNFTDTIEGVLSVYNSGTETAHDVHLEGDWFSFSSNDFDVLPGQTKPIIYTINPVIYNSNDTDKTHHKNITLTGNFPTVAVGFDIFINEASVVGNGNLTSGGLEEFIRTFCKNNPSICQAQSEVVIVQGNGSQEFNVSMSRDQVTQLWRKILEETDNNDILRNYMQETLYAISVDANNTESSISELEKRMRSQQEREESRVSTLYGFVVVIVFIVISALLGGLIYYYRKINTIGKLRFQ